MISKITSRPLTGLAIVALLIAVSIPFQIRIDNIRGKFRDMEKSLYISSSSLKKMSLGYSDILADIYWIRAIQYFGSTDIEEQNPELLARYFDIITDLDPRFVNAYRFGGTFLAEPPPFGLGDLEKGLELLEKGRLNNPENFRLPLEEAFMYYMYTDDYETSARLFNEAAEKEGLSEFRKASIKGMAASALDKSGKRESSRRIWEAIYETSPSESRRRFALMNIKEIDTIHLEEDLTKSLREYADKYNILPDDLNELSQTGFYNGSIPEAPVGGKFVIIPAIPAVKSPELYETQLNRNIRFLNAKARRYKKFYGRYPGNIEELKEFIVSDTTSGYPEHPLGREYTYEPESGEVKPDDLQ